ncbi:ferredoxin reductase [Solimonas terrae]|uniref:2Fe-2S iron-sulfur cluster binding domain-containing protein n=1 Tax=Solimonas terrae TaxID=1396819 RepID=A0A6M2BMG8_9GAMM|nr:ferredoxin reductase [Solimonas terrae]NGY03490.1 2Fe-2S iron-sulfur cluster binding domain-containing protein [Solimonas terrae]
MLRSPLLHPLNDADAINDLLALANPRWSLTEIRAEVVGREQQTADTLRFWLRPNRRWKGFRAGQHVAITAEIDGVRHTRVYSLSCDPAVPGLLTLTVKRQADGRVSNWLHDQLRVGSIVTLGDADGDFVLPTHGGPLLLLSAGSGITPMLALLYELRARVRAGDTEQDIVLVHVCRDAGDQIFANEVRELAADWPALRIETWHSASRGRPAPDALLAAVPDYATRDTFLCGPSAFMADIEAHWADRGITERLRLERFGAAPRRLETGDASEVRCARSERIFTTEAGEALLPAAERAGLKPAYGCRIGVCRTCLCHKRGGTVENLVTGERSGNGDEWIRLCVSTPRSDLELEI